MNSGIERRTADTALFMMIADVTMEKIKELALHGRLSITYARAETTEHNIPCYEVTLTIGQWDFDAEDSLEMAIQQIYAEVESFYGGEE